MRADISSLGGYNSIDEFVEAKLKRFEKMDHNMASLYEMMFSEKDNIMYETSIGYEIKTITYGEVKAQIEAKAKRFGLLGTGSKGPKTGEGEDGTAASFIGSDSVIGLYMDNSLEWIENFWCILMCGCSVLLMNRRLDDDTLEKAIRDCDVKAVISDGRQFSVPTIMAEELATGSLAEKAEAPAAGSLAEKAKESEEYEITAKVGISTDAGRKSVFGTTVYVMSSGTSASVKICGYSGEEFYFQVCDSYSIIKKCGLMKTHYKGMLKQLTFLPFYHIFGLVAVYIWFAFFSRTFVELKNFEPETITSTIKKHGVTHIFAVPLFWERVYEQAQKTIKARDEKTLAKFQKGMRLMRKTSNMPRLNRFLSKKLFKEVRENMFGESVVFMISGGSEIRPEILEFFNGIGYHLANGYGMSEVGITSVNLDKYSKKLLEGYVGEPFGSIEYKLTDEGNLCVRGKTVASTVIENGQKRSVGRDEWYDTKDMAVCENGQYRLLGRRDDVVISSTGENLNPNIIEPAFSDIKGVRNVCLIGPEREGVKLPVLVVSTDKFINAEEFESVNSAVREKASEIGLGTELKDILFTTDELMTSEDFKLNRRKIRADYEQQRFSKIDKNPDAGGSIRIDGNAMALKIRDIFAEAVDKPKDSVAYDTDFFIDLGGTSLDYFSMLCEIEEEFDLKIPDEAGTSLRTVQKLCEYINLKNAK
ncbi:MAG: AMP-binding protein [Lachnospiraceae bacterium]|nr:AMP-binding protein [Lachnospiraceae bacterium]